MKRAGIAGRKKIEEKSDQSKEGHELEEKG